MGTWVIDGQSVYCQDGLPHRCVIATDSIAIDYQTAQKLGIDLSMGEFINHRTLISAIDTNLACQLSQAIQLIHHQNTHKYCTHCGTPISLNILPICPNCHHHSYPIISPCIITAVIRQNPTNNKMQILLAKHRRHNDIYTLIAGFVEIGETLEMAVYREVAEEVGVQIDTPCYFGSQAWPHPSNLMVGFITNYRFGDITLQDDEIVDARFFDMDALPAIAPKGTIARKIIDEICSS